MTNSIKAAVVAALAGTLALHGILFWNERGAIRKGYPDFTIFYAAGRILGQHQGQHLYDLDLQFRAEQEFAPEVKTRQGALPYNHPPFEALLFVPMARVSYAIAYAVWNLLNVAILLLVPWLLGRQYPIFRARRARTLCFAGALAFFPVFVGLLQGQDIFLLVLLQVLAFAALKRNSDFAAGLWLGLGTFRIHLVLPLILLLLVWRRFRAGLGFALTFLCMAALSIATVGWKATLQYPKFVLHLENVRGWGAITPASMPNLRGLIGGWSAAGVEPAREPWLILALSAGLVVLVAILFANRDGDTDSRFDLSFCAAVVATLLIGYHTLTHDFCLLLLPILLLVNHRIKESGYSLKPNALLVGSVALLFFTPLYMVAGFRWGHFNVFALPLLGLLGGICIESSGARRTGMATSSLIAG